MVMDWSLYYRLGAYIDFNRNNAPVHKLTCVMVGCQADAENRAELVLGDEDITLYVCGLHYKLGGNLWDSAEEIADFLESRDKFHAFKGKRGWL